MVSVDKEGPGRRWSLKKGWRVGEERGATLAILMRRRREREGACAEARWSRLNGSELLPAPEEPCGLAETAERKGKEGRCAQESGDRVENWWLEV